MFVVQSKIQQLRNSASKANIVTGWVPTPKTLRTALPTDRAYTKLEAYFSLSLDYDAGRSVTITGYAALWRWSRGKVERFLNEVGLGISYPVETAKNQNQRGLITIKNACGNQADVEQIKFISFKHLNDSSSRKQADGEQEASRRQSTTKDTKIKTETEKTILPEWLPIQSWTAFLEMRKKQGKAPTEHGKKVLLSKLDGFRADGYNVAEILDNSVANCWAGLFPPNRKEPKHEKQPSSPNWSDPRTKALLGK